MTQLSGEAIFVLNQNEVHLHPGDWLVLNGVGHADITDIEPAELRQVLHSLRTRIGKGLGPDRPDR